jgi:hypothetical protein
MSTYTIDTLFGIGAISLHADTARVIVEMQPSVFLKLAHDLDVNSESASRIIPWVRARLNSRGIGHSVLHIAPPLEWRQGDFSNACRVIESDGRHRMHAIASIQGDLPVPVMLVPWQDISQQELNTWLPRLCQQLISQDGELVQGKLWIQPNES